MQVWVIASERAMIGGPTRLTMRTSASATLFHSLTIDAAACAGNSAIAVTNAMTPCRSVVPILKVCSMVGMMDFLFLIFAAPKYSMPSAWEIMFAIRFDVNSNRVRGKVATQEDRKRQHPLAQRHARNDAIDQPVSGLRPAPRPARGTNAEPPVPGIDDPISRTHFWRMTRPAG